MKSSKQRELERKDSTAASALPFGQGKEAAVPARGFRPPAGGGGAKRRRPLTADQGTTKNPVPFLRGVILAVGMMLFVSDAVAYDPHEKVFSESAYPSAEQCAACHKQIYQEWSSSAHAYASISPMFHKFEQRINDLTQGTIGTFCVRCHSSVGTAMGETRDKPLWEQPAVAREGITCIACHRVEEEYGRVNGERRIVPGEISEPVYGNIGGEGVAEVIQNKDFYKVATAPGEKGIKIHREGIRFKQLSQSEFCVSCHQVAVNIGIKLEVVWEQYRASPAFRKGIRCQDCHMSVNPGVPSGFGSGPVAVVNEKPVHPERAHHDHSFVGPGYSIAHPGIFPHSPDNKLYLMDEWLQFDYRAGWGEPSFEDRVAKGEVQVTFPDLWSDRFDREEARAVVNANLQKLEARNQLRKPVMEAGSRIDGPFFQRAPRAGRALKFKYKVTNLNPGHNLPSGSLGAQPEIWLNVVLIDPDGNNVWESGYVDANGDMADLHSHDVRQGKIAHDDQLFNLQTKFLTTNVKGTDREMYLPVNFDVDQLPFLRPPQQPVSVINHPPFVRMEGRSIPPLGSRFARYVAPRSVVKKPGIYRLAVRLRSRAEPVYFMKFVGATEEMERAMNEGGIDIHPYTVEFQVKPS